MIRVGFLGLGWIGFSRMKAMFETGKVEIYGICDSNPEWVAEALRIAPGSRVVESLDELLDLDLDGIAIATPSALHAEQAMMILEKKIAVFCQKPLGRDGAEVRRVIAAARSANVLLSVDLSYRHTEAAQRIRRLISEQEIGSIYAVDLIFHHAYGPHRPWLDDAKRSGGGCLIDLGAHLVDLALWMFDADEGKVTYSRLFSGGRPVAADESRVEDFASAQFDLLINGNIASVNLACSWNLHTGKDAVISAAFYGTQGGLALKNLGGSFFDFKAERYRGTQRELLCSPPDAWSGRAAIEWAQALSRGKRFDPEVNRLGPVSEILDQIYGH